MTVIAAAVLVALGGVQQAPPCIWTPDDCRFAEGYRDAGGPERYLRHLIEDVAVCEGGPDWSIVDYRNGYRSRLQFAPGSWATVSAATGRGDSTSPYDVGVNVAWWINHIDNPGGTGGWPQCWHVAWKAEHS